MFGPHGGPVLGAWDCGRAKVERSRVALGIRESCPHYSKKYPSIFGICFLIKISIVSFYKHKWIDVCYHDHYKDHCFFGSLSLSNTIPQSVSQNFKERESRSHYFYFLTISFLQQLLCGWHLITCV